MLETSNKFDEGKVTKEKNISFSKVTTDSYPSGIVETSDKQDISLMIEAEETTKTNHCKFERWYFFLINYGIQSKNDELIEKNKVDGEYEKLSLNVINGVVWLK